MKRGLKITIKNDYNHYALIEQVNNRENEINRGIFLDKDQYEQLRQHFVVGRSEQLVCEHPDEAIIRDKPTDYCLACNRNI